MKKWTIEDAKELYNINGWGTPYFSVNERGNVYVTPEKDKTQQVDLHDVMEELALRGVTPPVLLRFPTFSTTVSRRLPNVRPCPRGLWV